MFKILFSLSCLVMMLHADKKIEVFATTMDMNGSYVKASNDVVVLYDGLYVSAESASYDKQTGIVELYGNVHALKGAQYYAMGDYLMLDAKEDIRQFRPFFFQEHADELWISARSAKSKVQEYSLHSGVVSSCNPRDPDWTIRFSEGSYDEQKQWMQLYNARLYAGRVPVFYLPYIAYPTDKTRRTGLLRPKFGFSGDEGFMYQQPIYIAEDPQWDLEITPQNRVKRGKGLYSTLRFVDSPSSSGSVIVGAFRERSEYQKEFNLKNEEHYGAEFDYRHEDFLNTWFGWEPQGSSGIYSDITYLNDVEYLNIKENDASNSSTNSQVTSKVNLFLNQSENYFGTYFKYFIDLNKESNEDTLQNLPILQYHHYLNSFLNDHFFYSFDYRGTNLYRETRKSAVQDELTIPLELQFPLFNEYLTLTLSENLYASHLAFFGSNISKDPNSARVESAVYGYTPGLYGRDSQKLELNTNLVKSFDDFTHSMGFTAAYIRPGLEKAGGFYEDYGQTFKEKCTNNSIGACEFNTIEDVLEEASLEFSQYIFTEDEGEKLYHRLKQPLVYESGYSRYADLENELRYYFTKAFNYYNNTFYNYDRHHISKTQNSLGYNDTVFIFNLSYLYEYKQVNNLPEQTRYLTTDMRYNYSDRWQYYAEYAYDIESAETKNRHVGFVYSKRCWSAELKYVENIRPTLSALGLTSSIKDRMLYLTLNLRPLGGMEVHYKKSENQ